jgi:hypothetical protein
VPQLEQGRIIWARVRDPANQNEKKRPLVVLTRTEEILAGQEFVAVALTTSYSPPPGSLEVELPWHPEGKTRTQLRRRTVAVCDWLVTIRSEDVEALGGVVPEHIMGQIIRLAQG